MKQENTKFQAINYAELTKYKVDKKYIYDDKLISSIIKKIDNLLSDVISKNKFKIKLDNHIEELKRIMLKPIKNNKALSGWIVNIIDLAKEMYYQEYYIYYNNRNYKETNNQSRTILITSPTPQNGKSYIARELSKSLQQTNKKVLLIDIDMKRGDQHKSLGREKISLNDFRAINIDNLDKLKITENFYFIPKVSRLNNSFQFLYSEEFINKLELFKKNFDYIIIDTAPILSVSDTAMLMGHSDINLAIVRHGLTKINEIKQMVSIASQIGIDFDGFVYNAYQKPSSYYGYYGFYGNYSYQYYAQKYLYENYDYDKEN